MHAKHGKPVNSGTIRPKMEGSGGPKAPGKGPPAIGVRNFISGGREKKTDKEKEKRS